MRSEKKKVGLSILIILLTVYLVSSATVVQVSNQASEPAKKGILATFFGYITSPIFIIIVLVILFIMAFMIGVFFFVKWLVKYIKKRNNVFYHLATERKYMAGLQSRYSSNHWWKITKNTPMRLVKNFGGKAYISEPFAYHRGDFTSHEGNVIISMNMLGDNHLWFFPKKTLLLIPDKESYKLNQLSEDRKKMESIDIKNLPRAKDIVQFNPNEILIYAESISRIGEFLIPVLRSKDNKIVDLSLPVYASMREMVLDEYLYEQTDSFVRLSRKATDMNPDLRAKIKLNDGNQSIDTAPQ